MTIPIGIQGSHKSAHTALTNAISALAPTYWWDTSVASGNLTALAGGSNMVLGAGAPTYRTSIGSGGLVGVRSSGDTKFQATGLTLTNLVDFTMFAVYYADQDPGGLNAPMFHTGTVANPYYYVGMAQALLGSGVVNIRSMTANGDASSWTIFDNSANNRLNTSFTLATVYDDAGFSDGTLYTYVNGALIDTRIVSSSYRLEHDGSTVTLLADGWSSGGKGKGVIGYPALWAGTALTGANIANLHAASGL